ncbi:hypothetical protein [Geotalea uraniireducens]|uniref:Uncharacterized protein n=1 Tax=Geotalea uraniireducens (strain Rf4) TaxID=351605 RepID=A5G836_GEOUR|nr:hypothetical protein [Geotalea uraniireducens]ABQ27954.1 hypothetical protein Gura_3803 [Geotalea uraniireducens Rf4]
MSDQQNNKAVPEIDVDTIMEKITEELQLSGKAVPVDNSPGTSVNMTGTYGMTFNAPAVRAIIMSAEAKANAGAEVTPMLQFCRPIRKLAVLVGKIVVYLASFITDQQRSFNKETTRALRALTDGLVVLNNERAKEFSLMREEIRQLREEIETYKKGVTK